MASLLYGAGLRLMGYVRMHVEDVEFAYRQSQVRDGKGQNHRLSMLPQALLLPLKHYLEKTSTLHEQDLAEGFDKVYFPSALERTYADVSYQ